MRIQQMAAYDRAMLHALAMPDRTPAQQAARNRAIADARIQPAVATNRRLNPAAITRIDVLLGLPASDPRRGVEYVVDRPFRLAGAVSDIPSINTIAPDPPQLRHS